VNFQVIPAIDLRAGRCVRLFQGDYARETVFADDPVAVARRWEAEGARRLHLVDLDGARAGEPLQLPVVRAVAAAVRIPVQLGGGLRHRAAVQAALDAGVERAIIGTAALDLEHAAALFAQFGERLAVGIDARGGRVAVQGWEQESGWDAVDLARRLEGLGARRIIFTDIARDGTLTGPALEATRSLAESLAIPVIASGGIGTPADLQALAALAPSGIEAAIVGRALYTGAIRLPQVIAELDGTADARR
jgi:phosphoribosylformimino-5-aminoimidazole carboxamide ribotide isomerase